MFASYRGPHLFTWVKSKNVDEVAYLTTKAPGDGGNWTLALSARAEQWHQYTTAHIPYDTEF